MSKHSGSAKRVNGVVLIARKDSEYWFISSVFQHNDNTGCAGMIVHLVTEEMMDDLLSIDNLIERFGDSWEATYKDDVDENCEACDGWIDEDGCEDCGYPSCESFCSQYGNSDDVIDNPGCDYVEALDAVCENEIEYADCVGYGRIFHSHKPISPDDFDEVYNMKALVACLAYEDDAVDYDYAVRAILGA